MLRKNDSFEIVDDKKEDKLLDYSMMNSNISERSIDFSDQLGFWNNIYKNISDIKNIIKFNFITTGKKVTFSDLKYVYLYNRRYDLEKEMDELLCDLNDIFWFSYRSNFEPIIYNNKLYTSDAGWGCMIRAGQMILAKGIYNILGRRMYDDCVLLFSDNQIRFKNVINKPLFNYFLRNIGSSKEENIKCSLDEFECIIGEKKLDYITAPFSIRNICKISHDYNKGAGDWFSNYDIIKVLSQLNEIYNPIEEMKILHFTEGAIYLDEIINKCFRIKRCQCNLRLSYTFDMMNDYKTECADDYIVIEKHAPKDECKCFNNTFIYMNNHYEMTNKFILFM